MIKGEQTTQHIM